MEAEKREEGMRSSADRNQNGNEPMLVDQEEGGVPNAPDQQQQVCLAVDSLEITDNVTSSDPEESGQTSLDLLSVVQPASRRLSTAGTDDSHRTTHRHSNGGAGDDDDDDGGDIHDLGDGDGGGDDEAEPVPDVGSITGPPDGGWGWVVVFGSAVAFFLGGGVSRSFTLIYEQLLDIFHDTASSTSATAAIFGAVKMCTSPLVSLLCAKFSKRAVTVCGGLITAIAMLMTSFPVSLPYLYFTYGILAAFGFNMVLTPCFVIVGEYFRRRRARAMSLAMLGGSLGGVSLPPLLNFLFRRYGYSGTMFIVSGLVLNLCVAGSLFRSLGGDTPGRGRTRRKKKKKEVQNKSNCADETNGLSAPERGDGARKQDSLAISIPNIVVRDEENGTAAASGSSEQRQDSDSLSVLPRRSSRQVSFQIEGAIHLPNSAPPPEDRKRGLRRTSWHKYYALLKSVGIPLYRQPRFAVYSLLMLGSVLSLSISGVFLSGLVRDLGLRQEHTGFLLSGSAAVDIPSKFLSGFVFDLRKARPCRSLLLAVLGFLTGVFSLSMAFCTGFPDLFVVYMLYTFFASAYHTQHATVLADLVGSSNLSAAMGLCRLSQGIGFILGPTVGGHIRDMTGRYQSAYVFSGCILLAFTIAYTSVDAWLLWKRYRKEQSDLDLSELSDGHVARYRHDSISTIT